MDAFLALWHFSRLDLWLAQTARDVSPAFDYTSHSHSMGGVGSTSDYVTMAQRLSQAVHTILYGLIWLMPLAGCLMSLASGRAPVLMGFLPAWLGTEWFPRAFWGA